jgi:hypothetical protein
MREPSPEVAGWPEDTPNVALSFLTVDGDGEPFKRLPIIPDAPPTSPLYPGMMLARKSSLFDVVGAGVAAGVGFGLNVDAATPAINLVSFR